MDNIYIGSNLESFSPGSEYPPISGVVLAGTSRKNSETEDTGRKVYITSTGNRYHSDPRCGGGTYFPTTLSDALERGLSPCQNCGGDSFLAGDTTGYVIEASLENPTQEIAEYILRKIKGYSYRPFTGSNALIDMSAELGDGITVGGIYSILADMDVSLDYACAANISAPSSDADEDEYPYIPQSERELKKFQDKMDDIDEDIDGLQDGVDGLQDDVAGIKGELDDIQEQLDNLDVQAEDIVHPRTDEIDFTEWENGHFSERLNTGETVIYDVEFDSSGAPSKFINTTDGHECVIQW